MRGTNNRLDLRSIEKEFCGNMFRNEDDVKIHFHSDILKPLIKFFRPDSTYDFKSENTLHAGGRTDATFREISFEYKRYNYFQKQRGIEEALYGRNDSDHGLYDYIISSSGVLSTDSREDVERKIITCQGVGFDGCNFLFARFVKDIVPTELSGYKGTLKIPYELKLKFYYEKLSLAQGIERLARLVKQQTKIDLSKQNVLSVINAKSEFVRESVFAIYDELCENLDLERGISRVKTLYREWDRVFGVMYGEDSDATDFTEVSSAIRMLYDISNTKNINSKVYLFSLQTFFNMFLKLLIYSFLSQMVDPAFSAKQTMTKADIDRLFDGEENGCSKRVANFFETHYLEWFTFTSGKFEVPIVNRILEEIDKFNLGTFILKPESVQDILQEVYMELIPDKMRHLMGEYFSPDWIVEHALDMVGYTGDMEKSLVDPTAGSGPFLTQALKRIIASRGGVINRDDMEKITRNVVGFDINPISVVAAKANYILILFSAYKDEGRRFGSPITIPVFIADSILAPVVYAEESGQNLEISTSVGKLTLPKFVDFKKGNEFLSLLSNSIHEKAHWETFRNVVVAKRLIQKKDIECVKILFDRLYVLHRSGCDSFWPIILRNSYAPIMIGNKFDFVVGNPPWISWKAMSKSYREGTLKIWWSYEIFEKNAYDKKTTHDDFGMAVTYVAMDQYLKNGGSMVFLLPASFLKSTKGGEGFRKFRIIRNGQDIPFSVEAVHDFSEVNLFTVPTSAVRFVKGTEMRYPMQHYRFYTQIGSRSKIDPHWTWNQVAAITKYNDQIARPIDLSHAQSAWLTLDDMTFADKLTDKSKPRYYGGRKGVEPAGAKGVYILEKPVPEGDGLVIRNDISRQRRMDVIEKGVNEGFVERDFIYPMLGGRNIARWKVKSTEYMIVPHTAEHKYGVPESVLSEIAPSTFLWLEFYREKLFETRVRNGKFFNPKTNPFYRLDNVGPYTFSPYKVLWKEQAASMSAVVVHTYLSSIPDADPAIFPDDKPIVVDSKVLMLGLDDEMEAYYVCGVINARSVIKVVDGYAIGTNRGVDVLKNIAVPKFIHDNPLHCKIATLSKQIHEKARGNFDIVGLETILDKAVCGLFEVEGNVKQQSLHIVDTPEEGGWEGRMAAFEETDA